MGYATTAQLNLSDGRLIELTASDSAPTVADNTLLAQLLAETQSIIDGKIKSVLPGVPFADGEVPPLIITITGWIWAYRVYRHREVMQIPQSVKDDYALAMKYLEDIVAGTMDVGIVDGSDPSDAVARVAPPSVGTSHTRGWTRRSEWCPE